jgi:hypothetical protein
MIYIDGKLNEQMTAELARAFFDELDSSLSHRDILAICERNARETNPNICHSHDFCDANEAMADAWAKCEGFPEFDLQNDEHRALWSAAWNECKRDYLQYSN